jgi:uncharacterized protein YoxC
MPEDLDEASWAGYRRLVISELERIDRGVKGLHDKMDARDAETDNQIASMKTQIALLQVKSGTISALVSAVTGLAVAIGAVLLRH